MTKSLKTPIQQNSFPKQQETWANFAEASPFPLPLSNLDVSRGELATCLHTCIRLDWEDLQCFEMVNRQFQQLGVIFANAIALRPSNSAYPAYSGVMVVMGSPKMGWIEASFSHPVRFVSGVVTSPRRTILTAFDGSQRLLAQTESPGANLAGSESRHSPNIRLSLDTPNIHRVTFHTFNSHLTLDDFCFSF